MPNHFSERVESVLRDAQKILRDALYRCEAYESRRTELWFEDDSLVGIVAAFPSAADLLREWSALQDTFLGSEASALRTVPEKAWNVYCVLLTPERPHDGLRDQLARIEEDLVGTRKLVGTGLADEDDIRRALAPLLPVRPVALPLEDLSERIRTALGLSEATGAALLSGDSDSLAEGFLKDR